MKPTDHQFSGFFFFKYFSVIFDFLCYTGFSNAEIKYISLAEAITEPLNVQSDQSSLCAQWVAKDTSVGHADCED